MARVERVIAVPIVGAGDVAARQVAEGVSVGLVLDDGRVAWGDCVAGCSDQAGREPVFRSRDGLESIQRVVAPALQGRELTSFRVLTVEMDALTETATVTRKCKIGESGLGSRELFRALAQPGATAETEIEIKQQVERPLHAAVRYGVSQALLQAVASARNATLADVIADEWKLPRPNAPVPIHAQCGGERYHSVDKLIVHRVASLPGAPVDNVPEQVGEDGGLLRQYVYWLAERIRQLGGPDYAPTIHLDVRGALGQICGNDPGRMLGQLYALEMSAQPYLLRIQDPLRLDDSAAQLQALHTLREYIRFRELKVKLVAGEWVDRLDDIRAFILTGAADMLHIKPPALGGLHQSVEAVRLCKAAGVGAFLGGSPAETDLAARASAHVALATQPDLLLAKPGVDEGVLLVQNEMARALAQIRNSTTKDTKEHEG